MKGAWEEAQSALNVAAKLMKEQVDKHRRPARQYKVGERVWLETTNITTIRPSKKLDDKRVGPFTILKKVGRSAYKLDIPKSWKAISPTFNESLLSPYTPPSAEHQGQQRPPPDLVDNEEEYEVEEILNSKRSAEHGVEYYVKWKGYPIEESTWEPPEHLSNALDKIAKFH